MKPAFIFILLEVSQCDSAEDKLEISRILFELWEATLILFCTFTQYLVQINQWKKIFKIDVFLCYKMNEKQKDFELTCWQVRFSNLVIVFGLVCLSVCHSQSSKCLVTKRKGKHPSQFSVGKLYFSQIQSTTYPDCSFCHQHTCLAYRLRQSFSLLKLRNILWEA